jgi:dephospho-CoA kinase
MNESELIALTGVIGTGKSSVARCFGSNFNVELLNSDQICRELLKPHEKGWQEIFKEFGCLFFDSDENLKRQELREAIFNDSDLRLKIDSLIHPLVKEEIVKRAVQVKQDKPARVLVEIPLLFEADWQNDYGHVIVVYASHETCVSRVASRDNVSGTQVEKAIGSQVSMWKKITSASHIINNNGSWLNTCLSVLHLGHCLKFEKK